MPARSASQFPLRRPPVHPDNFVSVRMPGRSTLARLLVVSRLIPVFQASSRFEICQFHNGSRASWGTSGIVLPAGPFARMGSTGQQSCRNVRLTCLQRGSNKMAPAAATEEKSNVWYAMNLKLHAPKHPLKRRPHLLKVSLRRHEHNHDCGAISAGHDHQPVSFGLRFSICIR